MKVDDWVGLIESLPPAWRPWVLLAMTVMPLVSTGLMVVKAMFVIPSPKEVQSVWKKLGLYLLVLLDAAATNSPPIITKLKEREARPRTSIIPPGTGLLVLVLPLLVLSCAAAPPPLETHARIAEGTAQLISHAGQLIHERLKGAEEATVEYAKTREEALARIAQQREAYAPLELAYEAVRQAHIAYVVAIRRADEAGHGAPDPDLPKALQAAWRELVARAHLVGLRLPTPPPGVAGLLGGGP